MFEIDSDEFNLPFFKDQGFTRRKCTSCGSHFWSSNPDQRTCGEVPCQAYTFLDRPPTKKRYDVKEMRIQFLDYFAANGHTRIKPYPIVARWRNDVYLVGASIYDFQPYVTDGTMPPPANPLVVSQPSVRFTDIEQVGPTAGRHLTIFEMGGAHAFNYPDKELYWKDQTVLYHHKLLVDVLGVPSESINYKEHFWSGGGNAGPDLEGIVSGLEISTLVFMKYKVHEDQLIPVPIRTVDTGYGIERWSWLSQGSPSGFHAIYGPMLRQVLTIAGLDVDDRTARTITHAAGLYYSDNKPWRSSAVEWVASQLSQEKQAIQETIIKVEGAYAILDHTKTICFLLAEGIVPSNVGEGYLARLIIRRAARLARQLGISDKIDEIVEAQIKLWSGDFRVLRDMRGEVLEGLRTEMKKYEETIVKGTEAVVRLAKELEAKGTRKIPVDQLVELYDSQGLPPEIVKERAEKAGVEVEIPDNFLSLVAERHSRPKTELAPKERPPFQEDLSNLPSTRALYYDDQYQTTFEAKLIARVTDTAVVLDQTCFYPQGGGQPGDKGTLRFGGETLKVVDVQKQGPSIVHFLERGAPATPGLVRGKIDWARRQSLMRHHTSTHALLSAARRVLGEHVWQAGAQKDVETSRLDITHYRVITAKEQERIERLVNQVILRNLPVQANWLAREKAESKYGFRLYQGGAVPGAKIRVVRIEGWDTEACGGTHCKRTGEIGIFKIEKTDRLQDGVERITFSAGESALRHINQDHQVLAKTLELLGTSTEKLPDVIESLITERDKLAKEVEKLREKAIHASVKRLARKARVTGQTQVLISKAPKRKDVDTVDLADRLKQSSPSIVAVLFEVSDKIQVVAAAGDDAIKAGVNAAEIVAESSAVLGGGGGGRPFFATGGGPKKDQVDAAIARARQVLSRQLGLAQMESA